MCNREMVTKMNFIQEMRKRNNTRKAGSARASVQTGRKKKKSLLFFGLLFEKKAL